jgi:hypothetical protein
MKMLRTYVRGKIAGGTVTLLLLSLPVAATVGSDAIDPVTPRHENAAAIAAPEKDAIGKAPSAVTASPRVEDGVAPAKGEDKKVGASASGSGVAQEILRSDFRSQDKALAHRVEARWQSLIEANFEVAYAYTLPSYRQTHTAQQYRSLFGAAVRWRVAAVQGIRYDAPTVAHVRLNLETEHVPPWGGQAERMVTRLYETWLFRSGEWWLSVGR